MEPKNTKHQIFNVINFLLASVHLWIVLFILSLADSVFGSIFESMNIELPTITNFILNIAKTPHVLSFIASLILVYTGFGTYICWQKADNPEGMSLILFTSSLGPILYIFSFLALFIPLLTLVNAG
jgi:type II secretory pathway component PulF